MRNFALPAALGLALLSAAPALAQIVAPVLIPPPCSGRNCPGQPMGTGVIRPTAPPSAQRLPCPSGTVYNPQKGTCKVLPVAPPN